VRYRVQILFIAALSLVAAQSSASNVPSGQELLRQGRVDEAISAVRQQLAVNPANSAELFHTLCRADYMIGKFDGAIQNCEKAVDLSPGNSEYHLWLGRSYGEKAERSSWFTALALARKTRQQFEKAVELNGDNVDARSDLAEFYLEAPAFLGGGADKARSQADAMAKSNAATSHSVKARVAEKASDISTAEQEFRAAISGSANRPEAWIDLAGFYRRQKNYARMEDAIHHAVAAPHKSGNAFLDAASILLRTGRSLPEAAQLLSKYIHSGEPVEDAPVFRAHYLLGQILEKQGDKSGAIKEYEAALALSTEYADARDALNRLKR
jgi:tetratricopeptide (TPR) repeat protein